MCLYAYDPVCMCVCVYISSAWVSMSICLDVSVFHVSVLIPVPCVHGCMCPVCAYKVIKLMAFQNGLCWEETDCLQSCIMNKFTVAHLVKLGLLTTLVSRKNFHC